MKKCLSLVLLSLCLVPVAWAQTTVQRKNECTAAGASGTAYTCSISPAPAALVVGEQYCFVADVANTAAATINYNSLGAATLKKSSSGALADLAANDIAAGDKVCSTYQGSSIMQVLSRLGTAGGSVTASSTDTFTNKTYDAAATGNVLTLVGRDWFAATQCDGTTAHPLWSVLTSLAPTFTCVVGSTNTNMMIGSADFPDTDGEYAMQRLFKPPPDWTASGMTGTIWWSTNVTSGNAFFQVQVICRAETEQMDVAYNTAGTLADVAKAVANNLNFAAVALGVTGCMAAEVMQVRVFRDRTNASDTLGAGAVVKIYGVELTYSMSK